MPNYRKTALYLLETWNSPRFDTRELRRLIRAFRASFFHYTRRSPDHWTHPRRRWSGKTDRPEIAAPVLDLFCRIHESPRFPRKETDALLESWFQFMAAMLPVYGKREAVILIPVLQKAVLLFPEEKHYPLLLAALKSV